MTNKQVGIIGYAFDKGGIQSGSKFGPKVIRKRGLVQKLNDIGLKVKDLGDVSESENLKKTSFSKEESTILEVDSVYSAVSNICAKTSEALEADLYPLVLAGDHSVSIGSVAAVSNYYAAKGQKIGLIWVDTHPDINSPSSSPSKRAFGMSVAFLTGQIPGTIAGLQNSSPAIDPANLAFVGLRDVDKGERELIKNLNISAQTIKDVDLLGIEETIKRAIAVASKDTAGFFVSFDLDVCDPRIVPGTGTPIRGGLDFREAHLVVELLYESNKMLGFELVELNPSLDTSFQSADVAVSLIESALGSSLI